MPFLLGLLAVLVIVGGAALIWLSGSSGSDSGEETSEEIPLGEQVEAFQLPNVAAGQSFSLSADLGERDIVVVSYMGFF